MAGKKHKVFISVMSVFLALVMAAVQSVLAFDVDENSKQREELEQQTSQYEQQLEETKQTLIEKQEYSKELQSQISELSEKIKNSNDTITNLNKEIKQKQAEVDEKLEAIQDRLDVLRKRLRAIYLAGDTSSLEIILGAKDFSDFIDKTELVKSLSSYDEKLIASLQSEMDTISDEQKKLTQDKQAVEQEKKNLEKNMEQINELSKENSALIQELMQTEDELEKSIEENQNKQDILNEALKAYNEEMAEKARQAQAKAAQQGSSSEIVVDSSGDSYVWPCPGHTYLTSLFDENRGASNHGALDIADGSVYGAKVVACYAGTVFSTYTACPHDYGKFSSCGCGGGYGNYVMIDHGNGKISIYGHLSGVTVSVGDTVVAGQLIGYVGSTGYSTGPHLHFETRYNGVRYDPLIEY